MTTEAIIHTIKQVVQGTESQLWVTNMDALLKQESSTVRDFIRQAFQNYGVEVEFSGKGPYEKGVVIDLDPDQMQEMGLNPDVLRFGQTVVKLSL